MKSKLSKKAEAMAIFSKHFEEWEASWEGQQDPCALSQGKNQTCRRKAG